MNNKRQQTIIFFILFIAIAMFTASGLTLVAQWASAEVIKNSNAMTMAINNNIKHISQQLENRDAQEEEIVCEENNNWTIIRDTLPSLDCSEVTFTGDVEVRGFVELAVYYVGAPEPLFRVIDEDICKLPYKLRRPYVRVEGRNIKSLPQSSPENPIAIRIVNYRGYCEGSPTAVIR